MASGPEGVVRVARSQPCFSLPMKMNILVGVGGTGTEVTLCAALLPKETVLGGPLFLPSPFTFQESPKVSPFHKIGY